MILLAHQKKQRRIFISYSRINEVFAVKLAVELKSAGYSVWLDQLDIPTGARWDDEIEKALRECSIFLAILTPAFVESENAKDEIGYAIDHGKRILPVLLEDCDVPLRLRRFQYVDFTTKSYKAGIQSAKQLLRNLVMQDSVPVAVVPPPMQLEEDDALDRPSSVKPERGAQPVPVTSTSVPIQPVKKTMVSKPLMIGIGIGALSVLAIGAILFANLPAQPDPSLATEPGEIPVSGDSACPVDNSQPVDIYVENSTALTLDYYRIDLECQEQYYGTLDAKGNMTISTYVSHTLQFYDNQTGEFFFSYVANDEDYLEISGELAASGVTGLTVGYVAYDGGEFDQIGDNEWRETNNTDGEEHYFEEEERDEWSVYLYDSSRNINIQLNLWTREIILDDNIDQEPYVLYTIAEAE